MDNSFITHTRRRRARFAGHENVTEPDGPERRALRFLICHAGVGFAVAAVLTFLMVRFDFAGLGTLIGGSDIGTWAAALLTVLMGITFSSVQIAFAILADAALDDDDAPRR